MVLDVLNKPISKICWFCVFFEALAPALATENGMPARRDLNGMPGSRLTLRRPRSHAEGRSRREGWREGWRAKGCAGGTAAATMAPRPFQAFISRKYRSPSPSATSSVQVPLNPWTSKLCFFNTFPKLVRRIGHPRAQHSLVCTDSTGTASLRGTPKPLAAIPNRTPTVPRSLLALPPRSLS